MASPNHCHIIILDDIIPQPPPNMVPNGTYVIRKGRKERQRLIDIDTFQTFVPPEISDEACKETDHDEDNDDIDDVDNVVEQNGIDAVTSNSLNDKQKVGSVPSYRHSIDLTVPTPPTQFSAHSPRYALHQIYLLLLFTVYIIDNLSMNWNQHTTNDIHLTLNKLPGQDYRLILIYLPQTIPMFGHIIMQATVCLRPHRHDIPIINYFVQSSMAYSHLITRMLQKRKQIPLISITLIRLTTIVLRMN